MRLMDALLIDLRYAAARRALAVQPVAALRAE
jgi:hypothetical protein